MHPLLLPLMSQCYIRSNTFCSNKTINCTLWETYAYQFLKFNQDWINTSGPTVLLLQYAKVKEEGYSFSNYFKIYPYLVLKVYIFNLTYVLRNADNYPFFVTNTNNVTKLSINVDIPSINHLINMLHIQHMLCFVLKTTSSNFYFMFFSFFVSF